MYDPSLYLDLGFFFCISVYCKPKIFNIIMLVYIDCVFLSMYECVCLCMYLYVFGCICEFICIYECMLYMYICTIVFKCMYMSICL